MEYCIYNDIIIILDEFDEAYRTRQVYSCAVNVQLVRIYLIYHFINLALALAYFSPVCCHRGGAAEA